MTTRNQQFNKCSGHFQKDYVREHLGVLSNDEILKRFSREDRLKGLSNEDRLNGLSLEEIQGYLEKQKKD